MNQIIKRARRRKKKTKGRSNSSSTLIVVVKAVMVIWSSLKSFSKMKVSSPFIFYR